MQQKEDKEKQKQPIEMTTDEAIDYVFGQEIADCLRQEAGKNDPEDSEAVSDD
jgi:hypothetical protein